MRVQRSAAAAPKRRAGTSVRVVTSGCTAWTPSMVASRTTSSTLRPLSRAAPSVTRTPGSGGIGRALRVRTRTPPRPASVTTAPCSRPRPSNTRTESPARKRRTCVR